MLYEVITAAARANRPAGGRIDTSFPARKCPHRITSYNVCYTKLLRVMKRIIAVLLAVELAPHGVGVHALAIALGHVAKHDVPAPGLVGAYERAQRRPRNNFV